MRGLFSQTNNGGEAFGKAEHQKIARLEHKIEEDKLKVGFTNAIEVTKDMIYIGGLAKILKKNGTD